MMSLNVYEAMMADKFQITYQNYRIAQNFGKVKLWRIGRLRILARKTLANTLIGHDNVGEIQ